jgi:hypothetical protein
MRFSPRNLTRFAVSAALFVAFTAGAAQKDARVTQVVRQVNLLPEEAAARPAALNDKVSEGTGVRTGDSSRSELTFGDLTITRLGANSIFSFNKGGRDVRLDDGSVLLRVPKNSGGATIATSAVTAGISGTTVILETAKSGRNKLLVLEGGARLSLNKHRDQAKNVRAGQMLDVPAGATTLPDPVEIDLNETLKRHPLLAGFPPLPSQDLIVAAAREQKNRRPDEPVYQGQPVAGQPSGPFGGGGFGLPPRVFPNPFPPRTGPGGRGGGGNPGGNTGTGGGNTSGGGQRGEQTQPTPPPRSTPPPRQPPPPPKSTPTPAGSGIR